MERSFYCAQTVIPWDCSGSLSNRCWTIQTLPRSTHTHQYTGSSKPVSCKNCIWLWPQWHAMLFLCSVRMSFLFVQCSVDFDVWQPKRLTLSLSIMFVICFKCSGTLAHCCRCNAAAELFFMYHQNNTLYNILLGDFWCFFNFFWNFSYKKSRSARKYERSISWKIFLGEFCQLSKKTQSSPMPLRLPPPLPMHCHSQTANFVCKCFTSALDCALEFSVQQQTSCLGSKSGSLLHNNMAQSEQAECIVTEKVTTSFTVFE